MTRNLILGAMLSSLFVLLPAVYCPLSGRPIDHTAMEHSLTGCKPPNASHWFWAPTISAVTSCR